MGKKKKYYTVSIIVLVVLILSSNCLAGVAYIQDVGKVKMESAVQVPVEFQVKRLTKFDAILLSQNGKIYYPLVTLYNLLKIKIDVSNNYTKLTGFIENPKDQYEIDLSKNSCKRKNINIKLSDEDYLVEGNEIYFTGDFILKFFDFEFKYDPKKLIVKFEPKIKLPAIAKYERAKRREFLIKNDFIPEADKEIGRTTQLFGGARLYGDITSYSKRWKYDRHNYNGDLSMSILGGNFDTRIRGSVQNKILKGEKTTIMNEDWFFLYQYPFFNQAYLRQINIGDMTSTSKLPFMIRGFEVTNRPAGRYIVQSTVPLSLKINANDEMEYYLRGHLNSYYIPLSDTTVKISNELTYGYNDLEAVSYDNWGERRSNLYRYVVPAKMIPVHEFQYSLMGGRRRNANNQLYGNLNFSFGASSNITLGTGVEYIENDKVKNEVYPFSSAIVRIAGPLIGDFSFSPFSISAATVTYYTPNQGQISINQTFYSRNKLFNPYLAKYETIFSFYFPVYFNSSSLYLNTTLGQRKYEALKNTFLEASTGFNFADFQLLFSSSLSWQKSDLQNNVKTVWNTTSNVAFRAPADLVFRSSLVFNHLRNNVQSIQAGFGRPLIKNMSFDIFANRLFNPTYTYIGFSLTYYPSFLSARVTGYKDTYGYNYNHFFASAVNVSSNFKNIIFDNQRRRDRGYILITPFLDRNNNLIKDNDEEILGDLRIKSRSKYFAAPNRKVSNGTLVFNADAYQSYICEVDENTIPNPLWIKKYKGISVLAEPGIVKTVYYPVTIGGIIRGVVSAGDTSSPNLLPGIKVILTEISGEVKSTESVFRKVITTFSNGEFEFLTVPPGDYQISLDSSQLLELGFKVKNINRRIKVESRPDGDLIVITFNLE
jgi:hypothetical protein